MKRALLSSIFLACFVSTSFLPALCQTRTLWEIGKCDQSADEFKASQVDHLVYQVGKGNWAQEWPRWQRAGSTYEIQFNLDAAPQGAYVLICQ